MFRRNKKEPAVRRYSWRSLALFAGGTALLAGAAYWARVALVASATAQPAAVPQAADARPDVSAPGVPAAPPAVSDYNRRVVAYLWETEPVTREELGEYLIARHGPEKLPVLVNMRIIDDFCRQAAIDVTAAEVEAAVVADLEGTTDQATVLKSLLSRYHMNLEEWKTEVVRPRLQLAKLCRHEVRVTDNEIEQAYESAHGTKAVCRIIVYPKTEQGKADAFKAFAAVRYSETEFDKHAAAQPFPALAATRGKIKPFGKYAMQDPKVDEVVFNLRPGEVSNIIPTTEGLTIFKCDGFEKPDTTPQENVRGALVKEMTEKKINERMKTLIPDLKERAKPNFLLHRPSIGGAPEVKNDPSQPRPNQVVAKYNSSTPITREELGEYLIRCYGTESVEFLVNHRIIEKEARSRGISVSDKEVDAALHEELAKIGPMTQEIFTKDFLSQYGKTLYEYREDAIRYRLALAKMCEQRVQVTESELQMAYDAYHGEKVECRMILWGVDQKKFVLDQYAQLRDSEEAFANAAKHQASATLATKGGKLEPFGHHTLGDDNLEHEAFLLKPGEVSTVIGTAQGLVVVKCDRHIEPDHVPFEKVRAELEREVRKRKVDNEIQVAFRQLSDKAQPKLLLRDPNRPLDLKADLKKDLADIRALNPGQPGTPPRR
jgi:parvulin-like peptidyl-prolyl isomerase